MSDGGYDEWLDALAEGDGFYLECSNGHGSLPPRRTCPHCGERSLLEVSLPDTGAIESYSAIHVPAPSFADDAPYALAIVDFENVRLTGVVRGIDVDDVETGMTVAPGVDETETEGEPLVVFRPV